MPQGDENPSNGRIQGPRLRNEILLQEDSLGKSEVDVGKRGNIDLNGMPELKDDQVQVNDEEVCLDLGEPSPEVMEYARRELGETDDVKCRTLQELRDMIYERGECLPHRMDDDFLIRFLRSRNFNVNRAHRLIVNYCNFKEEHPEIHQDVSPVEMKHIGEDDVMTVPAYRTQCGRRMMIYRLGNWDPRKYPVEELFKATVIILELGVLEPRAQILGGVAIFDLEGITMAHAWTITPQIASMVIALMVSAFPMITHAIHILHQSWVFDVIFSVFKPLLDVRMQNKIFFHGSNMDSLHKHISPSHLPKKYGGTREELAYYKWIDNLSKVPQIVKEMKQLGYIVPEEMQKQLDQLVED
ncbi:PREDICTED: alpha-tocopherol transfer protein-like isoform X2 [Eufriesea mexicana]|uniref:alpha-tocopherol transfer protein-like isoform X2 n=2 Tax=Eufriesea mexicana TaxID=516756 RepID=UPI00083BB0B5|nr:PREDICTED: alpha-tocopherol transfer protein-like isoform X2 [Eufriesea mexicana]